MRFSLKPMARWAMSLGLACVLVAPAESAVSQSYLTIPQGVRESAMGETGVSHAQGASAAWWNPARSGIGGAVDFHLVDWIADSRGTFGGAALAFRGGGISAYYFSLGMGGFEVRDRPGPAVGTFGVYNFAAGLAGAVRLGEMNSVGAAGKFYHEQIYGRTYTGSGLVDFGWSGAWGGVQLGAAVQNLELWDYVTGDLPTTYRLGACRRWERSDWSVAAAVEGVSVAGGGEHWHLGAEVVYGQTLALRTGYMRGYDTRDYTLGVGIERGRWRAAFSFVPFRYGLGAAWRAGLGVRI